jgi:hypothetical protein
MGVIPFSATDETSAALKAFADKKVPSAVSSLVGGERLVGKLKLSLLPVTA